MDLLDAVRAKRAEIAESWGELTLATYPAASAALFSGERDPFRNPVGATVRRSVATLLDGVLGDTGGEEVGRALDCIVRLRAVQDFTAGQAVGFVFLLRAAIGKALGDAVASAPYDQVADLGARIDSLCLAAVDVLASCRERLYALRADEAKARVRSLLRRAGAVEEESEEGPAAAAGGASTKGGSPV